MTRHGDLFLHCVFSTINSTHFFQMRCFALFFQRKQIIDLLNLNTLIFNFHFEFLIFIEKYDCVVCVVQRQRKKKFNMKMIYIILKLIKFHLLNLNLKFFL